MFSDVTLVDIDPCVRAAGDVIRQLNLRERTFALVLGVVYMKPYSNKNQKLFMHFGS